MEVYIRQFKRFLPCDIERDNCKTAWIRVYNGTESFLIKRRKCQIKHTAIIAESAVEFVVSMANDCKTNRFWQWIRGLCGFLPRWLFRIPAGKHAEDVTPVVEAV